MNKETVLKIVDSCFHEFASNYRIEAQERASELYDKLNTPRDKMTEIYYDNNMC